MSFTKTNWEDYPSKNTIISAARLNAMEDQIASALDGMESDISGITEEAKQTALAYTKTNIRLAIQGLFPEWDYKRIEANVANTPSLHEAEPYFDITAAALSPLTSFDPASDGLNIWVDSISTVVSKSYYEFSTVGDTVRVTFIATLATIIGSSTTLTFDIFKKGGN